MPLSLLVEKDLMTIFVGSQPISDLAIFLNYLEKDTDWSGKSAVSYLCKKDYPIRLTVIVEELAARISSFTVTYLQEKNYALQARLDCYFLLNRVERLWRDRVSQGGSLYSLEESNGQELLLFKAQSYLGFIEDQFKSYFPHRTPSTTIFTDRTYWLADPEWIEAAIKENTNSYFR